MRKTVSGLVLTLTALLLPAARAEIRLEYVAGDVRVQRSGAGRWEPVRAGDRLSYYDALQTGAASRATVVFAEKGNSITVDPLTRIVITESLGSRPEVRRSGVTVFVGKVRTKLAKGNPAADEFASPTTVIGVRGTEFVMAVADDGTTRVAVSSGEVKVEGASGETVLKANEVSTVPLGGDPEKTAFTGEEDWDAWMRQQAASIKGREAQILEEVAKALERLYVRMDAVEEAKAARWRRIEELQQELVRARLANDTVRVEQAGSEITRLVNESSRLVIEGQNLDIRAKAVLAVAERVVRRTPGRKDLRRRYDEIRQRFEVYHRRYDVRPKKGCLGR